MPASSGKPSRWGAEGTNRPGPASACGERMQAWSGAKGGSARQPEGRPGGKETRPGEAGWLAGGIGGPAQPKERCFSGLARRCGWPTEGAVGRAHPKEEIRPKEPARARPKEGTSSAGVQPSRRTARLGRCRPGLAQTFFSLCHFPAYTNSTNTLQ